MIGKLSFSKSTFFGMFARSQMRVLYRELHRKVYSACLSTRERAVLVWRRAIFRELTPRVLEPCKGARTTFCIPTLLQHMLGFPEYSSGGSDPPLIELLTKETAPKFWDRLFHQKNIIYGIELLAVLAFIYMNREILQNSSVNIYICNNNALCALIRGDSNTAVIADVTAVFWNRRLARMGRLEIEHRRSSDAFRELATLSSDQSSPYKGILKLASIVNGAKAHIFKELE